MDFGWKGNSRAKSRPSGRLNSWAPPPTPRRSSLVARRPRREIEFMRGHHGGHGGHHGGHHGGWRHGHRRVGFGGGILGGLFGRPTYRCRFVDRWGRCLDRYRGYYGR